MVRHADISQITKDVKRKIREGGIRGLLTAVQRRVSIERTLFPHRNVKSIVLDGCTFDLERLPNEWIKIELLNGAYEMPERQAVFQYLRPELPVIELGGCIGVVSCITNKLLKDPMAHVVVEASPKVLPHLIGNRDRNHCKFDILNAAIAYGQEYVNFAPSSDFMGNSLKHRQDGESVKVQAVRLGDIVSQKGFKSFTLICDIEGYEDELIQNEPEVLSSADTIILETHARIIGESATTELLDRLRQLGFETVSQESYVVVMQRSGDRLAAGGPPSP